MLELDTPKLAPHSVEAEQSVLGAILLDNGALEGVRVTLTAADFYLGSHQRIYRMILELADGREGIDNLTLAEALRKKGQLAEIGGAAYLAELVAFVPSAANITSYARVVAEKARRREIRKKAHDIIQATENGADLDALSTLLGDVKIEMPGSLASHVTLVANVKAKAIQFLWPGRLPLGKLSVLDGDPGLGKSLLTLEIAARLSTGRPMPDGSLGHLNGPRGVVLLSAEDDASDTIRPRLEAAGADLTKIGLLSAVRGDEGSLRPPHLGDVGELRRAIQDLAAALVVIDPLMAFIGEGHDSHRDHDIRRLLAPLAELAAETGASILVVRHLNKSQNGNPLYRGGGSIGIVGAARSGLLVALDPEDPEIRVLALTKSNLAAPVPSLKYKVIEASPGVAGVVWLGESTQTASSLLASADESGNSRTERDEAKGWLSAMLADGPVSAKQIRTESEQAGHAWATIRRAQRDLGVDIRKDGFQGAWTWRLPSKDAQQDAVSTFEKRASEAPPNPANIVKDAHASKGAHAKNGIANEHLWTEGDRAIVVNDET
jgi:RecA-family ATPase